MRQAGTIPNETDAVRFADYLFTLGIATKIDRDGEAWAIWVRDEEHVARASSELAEFQANPGDPKFATARKKDARSRREAQARREQEANRNFIDMRRRWDGRPTGPTPVTLGLIAVCIIVAVLTRIGGYFPREDHEGADPLLNALWFADQYPTAAQHESAEEKWHPLDRLSEGQVWRLFTPMLIHYSPWHLLFNMFWLRDFGSMIESRRGSVRFALLILTAAGLSNFGEYAMTGNPWFGGMSGVVYALFGYVWMKSRYEPTAEMFVHPNTVVLMMLWLVICMIGIVGPIANWAHGIGLAVGVAIGIAPYARRQTKKRIAQKMGPRGGKE